MMNLDLQQGGPPSVTSFCTSVTSVHHVLHIHHFCHLHHARHVRLSCLSVRSVRHVHPSPPSITSVCLSVFLFKIFFTTTFRCESSKYPTSSEILYNTIQFPTCLKLRPPCQKSRRRLYWTLHRENFENLCK